MDQSFLLMVQDLEILAGRDLIGYTYPSTQLVYILNDQEKIKETSVKFELET